MEQYHMITLAEASELPLTRLVRNYNDAVETIWYLQHQLDRERQENEGLWASYEEISNKLYG